jgi:hypothetical protein
MNTITAVLTALSISMGLPAGAASVTGTWTLAVDSPHGAATMSLVLKQDGTKVTGTFVSGHAPDMSVEGTFTDEGLKLSTAGDADHQITFTATLKDDGTFAGYLSSPMGDMKWTGERAKPSKDSAAADLAR